MIDSVSKPYEKIEPLQEFPAMYTSNDGMIVLMHESSAGTIICGGSGSYKVGHYSHNWRQSDFRRFDGEVLLKQRPRG